MDGIAQHGKYFAQLLKANKGLKNLVLAVNGLGDKAAQQIASALDKKGNTTIKEVGKCRAAKSWTLDTSLCMQVNLKGNALTDKGAIAFAQALASNSTVTCVNLSSNPIGAAGSSAVLPPRCSHHCECRN